MPDSALSAFKGGPRKRSTVITARFDEDEARQIRRLAERSGLSVAALMRKTLLGQPTPRAARRPSTYQAAAAKVLAQLGKIGSNVNQLAHGAPTGRIQANGIEVALRDLAELRAACLLALGQEPDELGELAPAFKPGSQGNAMSDVDLTSIIIDIKYVIDHYYGRYI